MRIGIDLGGSKIAGLLLDEAGRELARHRLPTPRDDYRATVEAVASLVEHLEAGRGASCTVGVGIPGTLSTDTGTVKNANSTCLIGRALDRDLARRLARPIRLANDANCFALSEAVDGAGRDARVVFGVIVGTGTGGGVVVDRQPLVGPNGIAGEWGHNPLPWPEAGELPGPLCYCGKKGCIETFLSGPGLSRDFHAATGRQIPASKIATLAEQGEPTAIACLRRHEGRMARALASVVNLLDPDVVVLGGGLSKIGSLYENLPSLLAGYVFSDRVNTRILPPVHGDDGGVRGAAWLWPSP